MKRILSFVGCICLLSLCLIQEVYTQSIEVISGDTIKSNTTWSADTIWITGTVVVEDDAILTILPGIFVEFHGYYSIEVFGTLIARGSPGDTIIFTVSDTTGFSNIESESGGWYGLNFDNVVVEGSMNDNDSSVIEFCKFEYAKKLLSCPIIRGGVIYINNFSRFKIVSSTFTNNYGHFGGAVACQKSDILIHDNMFDHNKSEVGGALVCINSDPLITGNIFRNNYSTYDGGAISINSFAQPTLTGNMIANNHAEYGGGGIKIFEFSNPRLVNNILVNNTASYGGALEFSESSGYLMNNTIANNKAYESGGAIECLSNSEPVFINNIIYGNDAPAGSQLFLFDYSCIPDFYFCNLEGGKDDIEMQMGGVYSGDYQNNIDTDPMFTYPSAGCGNSYNGSIADWMLQFTSPCINGGIIDTSGLQLPASDYGGTKRIANHRIDIGAYEYHLIYSELCDSIALDTTMIADTIRVTCDVVVKDSVTLTIHPGSVVQFQGSYKLEILGSLFASGTMTDSIVFTINDTTGFAEGTSGWGGMEFLNFDEESYDDDTSVINFCVIQYCSGRAISLYNFPNLIISNSSIRYNGTGIDCFHSPLFIEHSGICNNSSGGIRMESTSNSYIRNCRIKRNSANNGGAVWALYSRLTIENTEITYNHAYIIPYVSAAEGGAIFSLASDIKIINSKICNNYSDNYGGAITYHSTGDYPQIINSIICNNSSGNNPEVIYCDDSNPFILNSTIAYNSGGIFCMRSSPRVTNSLLYNNGTNFFLNDNFSDPDITYSGIEYGMESIYVKSGDLFEGKYLENIEPYFYFVCTQPPPGRGYLHDGLAANWSLNERSECINAGDPNTKMTDLPELDLGGNPRIYDSRIDMGAYENHAGPPYFIEEPQNQIVCEGETVILSVITSGEPQLLWYKDNERLYQEQFDSLVIFDVRSEDEGTYYCELWNAFGSKESKRVLLVVDNKPTIIQYPEDQWSAEGENVTLRVTASGSDPLYYHWRHNGEWISEVNGPELVLQDLDFDHEGIYRCDVNNECGATFNEGFSLYLAPQICMVTVSGTGDNLVVWEKKSSAPIASYNIYRESIIKGIYSVLDNVDYNNLSLYHDETADPTIQAYWYKITAVDINDEESDIELCNPHKTIHLLTSTNPETKSTQLSWDEYLGFDYGTYHIYRSLDEGNFDIIWSMASSSHTWTDNSSRPGVAYYRIAAEKFEPCYPAGGGEKTDSVSYSHSMSNVDDNRLKTSLEIMEDQRSLSIFPNPFNQSATIRVPNTGFENFTLYITDLSGKIMRIDHNITSSAYVLDRKNLDTGCYFLELHGNRILRSIIIIE